MVIMLDKRGRPMGFSTEKRARILLDQGRAVIHKKYPFTIRVKDVDSRTFEKQRAFQIKIDPGSKHTGIAIVEPETNTVQFFAVLEHHGDLVSENISTRRMVRRNRRNRETRYRRCKFDNRKGKRTSAASNRCSDYLPPSVKSVADNVINFVRKISKLVNITKISIERVKFDTQLMDNPDISGVDYQHGELFGYEVKAYLLEKYGHTCQYCGGVSGDNILEVEHKISKANGGTNKVSNLTLACRTCNQAKGSQNLDSWLSTITLKRRPSKLDKARIQYISKHLSNKPLVAKNYAAWVNSSRNYLVKKLSDICENIECSSGGVTAYNRNKLGLGKAHYIDALCVGNVPSEYHNTNIPVLVIKAYGRGMRRLGTSDKYGFLNKRGPQKFFTGKDGTKYQTGDIVRAVIPKGKHPGTYTGRIVKKQSGYFSLRNSNVFIDGVNHKYCTILQRNDGYGYQLMKNINQ